MASKARNPSPTPKETPSSSRSSKRSSRRRPPAIPKDRPKRRTRGFYVIRWIETHCVHTKGRWIGQRFKLLPWQKRLILELFELQDDGLRRYRWALVGVPKKQGKTELAAALGLYFLIGDGEPAPLVVCAAGSDEQADLVFGAAKTMCEHSPTLRHITERWDKTITVPSIPGAELKRVAAAGGTNDGPSIHVVICDELHEWLGKKGRDVWTILTNGTGARDQPMVLQITTAGYERDSVCYEQYDLCQRIERGEVDDPRYFFHWTEAPEGARHDDPAVWAAANPSYGITVKEEFYRDQLTKKAEYIFRRYYLNQWTQAGKAWLPAGAWAACADPPDLENDHPGAVIPDGAAVYLGIDIGFKRDSSAVAIAWPRPDGRTHIEAAIFDPPGNGEVFDLEWVENHIIQLALRLHIMEARYDKYGFIRSAQILMNNHGINMVELPMSNERMVPATNNFYEAALLERLVHNGDKKLAKHIAATTTKDTPNGTRIWKFDASQPMDGTTAAVLALSGADQGGGGMPGVEW